jgi:hypothetical protein
VVAILAVELLSVTLVYWLGWEFLHH